MIVPSFGYVSTPYVPVTIQPDSLATRIFKAVDGLIPSLPVAQAETCTSLKVLKAAFNERGDMPAIGDGRALPATIIADFKTEDEAKAYLEKQMGPIATPRAHCFAENALNAIAKTSSDNASLDKAYKDLHLFIDQDALEHCEKRILEFLKTLSTKASSYKLSSMKPLPKVLSKLQDPKSLDFTFADYDLLMSKIHELAEDFIPKYQKTNQETTLKEWIDIILDAAEKSIDLIPASFKASIRVLQVGAIDPEQVTRLRKIATRFQMGAISPQDKALVDKLLLITGSKTWIFSFINGYLEALPDDIDLLNGKIVDIWDAFLRSNGIQLAGCAALLPVLMAMPSRAKNAMIAVVVILAAVKCVKLFR